MADIRDELDALAARMVETAPPRTIPAAEALPPINITESRLGLGPIGGGEGESSPSPPSVGLAVTVYGAMNGQPASMIVLALSEFEPLV